MDAQRQTATPWQGRGGGNLITRASANPTTTTAQSQRLDLVTILEAGIAEIERARAAKRRAVSDGERWHARRVEASVAAWIIENVLTVDDHAPQIARIGHAPTLGTLRNALALQQRIIAARDAEREACRAVDVAWRRYDGSYHRAHAKLADARDQLRNLETRAAWKLY